MARYRVDDEGRIDSDLGGDRAIFAFMRALKRGLTREDYAATVQKVLEDTMLQSLQKLLAKIRRGTWGFRAAFFPTLNSTGC